MSIEPENETYNADATPVSTPPNGESAGTSPKGELFDFAKIVLLILVLLYATRTFVVEGYEVQGPSMIPTLHTGERILVFKLPFQLYKIGLFGEALPFDEGDIVVFDGPDDAKKRYVKRLVAQGPPGHDSNTVGAAPTDDESATVVRLEDGSVYVNNQKVLEPYLNLPLDSSRYLSRMVEVHSGEYYMLGDNRDLSKDSRTFGSVKEKDIIGRAVLRFWPLSRFSLLK